MFPTNVLNSSGPISSQSNSYGATGGQHGSDSISSGGVGNRLSHDTPSVVNSLFANRQYSSPGSPSGHQQLNGVQQHSPSSSSNVHSVLFPSVNGSQSAGANGAQVLMAPPSLNINNSTSSTQNLLFSLSQQQSSPVQSSTKPLFQTNNSHMSSAVTMRFRSPNFLESQQHTSNGPLGLNDNEFPSLGGAFGVTSQANSNSSSNMAAIGAHRHSSGASAFGAPPLMPLTLPAATSYGQYPAASYMGKPGDQQRPPYAVSEFNIDREDFPALPGAQANGGGGGDRSATQAMTSEAAINAHSNAFTSGGGVLLSSSAGQAELNMMKQQLAMHQASQMSGMNSGETRSSNAELNVMNNGQSRSAGQSSTPLPQSSHQMNGPVSLDNMMKKGIQTSRDGRVTGIPPGMLNDQFGMAGLLTFLRAIETDPGIVALALGHDLTALGLNLNAIEKNLYQSFGGPWADTPCRAQDIDYHVPDEYLTNASVRDKLPPIKLNRYNDELLFYLFYNCPGEIYQVAAAAELYSRDWRYHMEERVWLTRVHFNQTIQQTNTYERGMYSVFDPLTWRKVPKELTLEYKNLEERPVMPNHVGVATAAGQQQQQQQMAGAQQQQQQQQQQHHAMNSHSGLSVMTSTSNHQQQQAVGGVIGQAPSSGGSGGGGGGGSGTPGPNTASANSTAVGNS